MNLIYKETGTAVKVGDEVTLKDGVKAKVSYFRQPHSPASEGRVSLDIEDAPHSRELYVSVIGAEWINREDRKEAHVVNDGFGSFVVYL